MRTTLANVKASRIPESVNAGPTDPRLVQFVNETQQRLIATGHWHGTMARYYIYAYSGLITLPPQIAAIEKVNVNSQPFSVRDQWYEFIGNGWGSQNPDNNAGSNAAIYRGRYPTFADIIPTGKRVRLVCDALSDVAKEVRVLGYDDDQNWIRTQVSGVWGDGETIDLAQTLGTNSTKNFSVITDIQLPSDLDGQVWLYEYDDATGNSRLIGQYQHWETNPSYARYFFPSIAVDSSSATYVEIMAKLDHVPVSADTDYLVIGNLAALKLGCMAVKAEEEHRWEEAEFLWQKARKVLDEELGHYTGDGRQPTLSVQYSGADLNDAVQTVY